MGYSRCLVFICAILIYSTLTSAQNSTTSSTPDTYLSKPRDRFYVQYEWKTLNYTWPAYDEYLSAKLTRNYIPENVIPSGIKCHDDRLYITLPRLKNGVPATLAWIPAMVVDKETSPLLTPFPSWEKNKIGNCDNFQNVQGIEIDKNGSLWVLDIGRVNTMYDNGSVSCLPSLSIIDLNDPTYPTYKYEFPKSLLDDRSYLKDLVIDDTEDGDFAYITDNSRIDPGIVVFSRREQKSWKFRDNRSMVASMSAMEFTVGNVRQKININLDGIALGPRYLNNYKKVDRNVYFSPLTSFRLYGVPASILRAEPYSLESPTNRMKYVLDLGAKHSQTSGMIMDEEGYLFFGLLSNHSIASWYYRAPLHANQEIIARDANFIQWVDRFAFDLNGTLYTTINKLQNFIEGKVDPKEYNYRILRSHTGTKSYIYNTLFIPVETNETGGATAAASSIALMTIALAMLLH